MAASDPHADSGRSRQIDEDAGAVCHDRGMPHSEELSDFTEIALSVRGMDVRVYESDVITGPAFVLVHGFGVSSRYFGPLARELSQYGRVLVIDLPGFGKTSDPDHAPRIGGFAHVVNAIIRKLEVVDPVLVGHSMGTQVVVDALVHAPGLSCGALLAAPVVNDQERNGALLLWRFIQSAVKEPPVSAWDSIRGFLHSGPRWLLRNFQPMVDYRIEDRIREISAPVAVVGGRGDRIAPPQWCRRLATRHADSKVVIVEDAAHQMIHTNAAEVARIAVDLAKPRHPATEEGASSASRPPTRARRRHSPGLPPCGD